MKPRTPRGGGEKRLSVATLFVFSPSLLPGFISSLKKKAATLSFPLCP
jgi:hypothetical protein